MGFSVKAQAEFRESKLHTFEEYLCREEKGRLYFNGRYL